LITADLQPIKGCDYNEIIAAVPIVMRTMVYSASITTVEMPINTKRFLRLRIEWARLTELEFFTALIVWLQNELRNITGITDIPAMII